MALPQSAQARLDALRTEGAPAGDPPPSSETPPATPPAGAGSGESVTISRDEFNELQAAAGRVRAAEGKAESVQMDVEALQARLTALEAAGKGSGQGQGTPPATESDDDWQPNQVQFTDKENEDYGESREFVRKVVLDTLNEVLPKIFGKVKNLKQALAETKQLAEGTVRNVERVEGADFTNKVREKVGNFDEVVNHQHWKAFAESEDPMNGLSYADTIRIAVQNRKLDVMVRVFNDFKTKYGLTGRPSTTGYEGGASGNGSRLPESNNEPEMLPLSKRKDAHRKWINKEISDADYQKIYDQYAAADKEGRVDYNA